MDGHEEDISGLVSRVLSAIDDHGEPEYARSLAIRVLINIAPGNQFAELMDQGLFNDEGHVVAQCLRQYIDLLRGVNLGGNCRLHDTGLEPIFRALIDAPCLASLDISNCGFTGQRTPSFYELIKNSTTLKTLILDWNSCIGMDFANMFGPALSCNTSLIRLSMKGATLFTFVDCGFHVLDYVQRHPTLKHVHFDRGIVELSDIMHAARLAELFEKNTVLESLNIETVHTTRECFSVLCRALYRNTSLTSLKLGRIQGECTDPDDVYHAIELLLAENVTLEEVRFDWWNRGSSQKPTVHVMVKRNMARKCSRMERARQAFITLAGLRRFRRPLAMKYIDKDIMRLVGRYIMTSKLRPEWEDPALWPVGDDGQPLHAVTSGQQQGSAKKQKPSIHVGARMGPWRMNVNGEWERVGDNNEG
jgi:hypothetical protein